MKLNLVDTAGQQIDYDSISPETRHSYGTQSLVYDHLDQAFGVEATEFRHMCDEDIAEYAMRELVTLSTFAVEYKASDDDWSKRLYRLLCHVNGISHGRISNDDAHTLTLIFDRKLSSILYGLLGACIQRGLGMENDKIVKSLQEDMLDDLEDSHAQAIACAAPNIIMYFSYTDPDLDEKEIDSLDMAILSCSTVDEGKRVSFYPEHFEMNKEELQRFFTTSLDILIPHYVEACGMKFADSVLRSTLIETIWRKFEDYIDNGGRRRRKSHFYRFATNEEPIAAVQGV